MSDDRDRFARSYRDLPGGELLSLYEKRLDLPDAAVEALRNEIRLRGIDPDSLTATVPKARSDEPPRSGGSAGPVPAEDADLSPSVPEGMAAELEDDGHGRDDPEDARVVCPSCGQPNLAGEARCGACHAALGRSAPHSAALPRPRSAAAAPASGTVASATFGLVGIAALVFAIHIATRSGEPAIAVATGALGIVCVGVALLLYQRARA